MHEEQRPVVMDKLSSSGETLANFKTYTNKLSFNLENQLSNFAPMGEESMYPMFSQKSCMRKGMEQ